MALSSQRTRTENSASRQSHGLAVTINYLNEQLCLDPPCPEIVSALATISRTAIPDAEHGYRLVDRRESLLEPTPPRPMRACCLPSFACLAKPDTSRSRCDRGPGRQRPCLRRMWRMAGRGPATPRCWP